jgi:hypothetical protein
MIGIHQKQEKMNKLHESLGLNAGSLTSVGPFLSRQDALEWQRELQQKFTDCAVISFGDEEMAPLPWYGFSFEK